MRFVYTFLLISITSSLLAFEPYNFTITAKKGDGIFSILRKYKLLNHSCSKTRFLELNDIQITDHLQIGKEYKLPIKIYEYNGTSIRTTIGIDSWEQAVRIKEYNELIHSKKVRKTNYTDSNILWVPYHELHCSDSETGKETVAVPTKKVKNTKWLKS